MTEAQTIPQYFLKSVQKYGAEKVALRQKAFGIWREFTWQESYEQVRDLALGLLVLGVQRGDHICTVGDNDRQYLWAYIAIQAVGAAQVGIFTDAPAHEVVYIAAHSDAVIIFAKDQEQCDKFLEIKNDLPQVRQVIYWNDKGLWDYDDPWLMSFDELQARGRAWAAQPSDRFEQEVALGKHSDIAILCYTSGTTGKPKGAMLTHLNLIRGATGGQEIDPRYDTDNHVSLLPLGWIAEHELGVVPHVHTGIIMNFPEEPQTVRENVREIAPEGVLYNSRLWDGIVSTVQVRINEATWFNRKLYDIFLPLGYRLVDKKFNQEDISSGLRFAYYLGDLLLFGPLRDQLGLSNIRAAYTAGSALSPDALRFFHALGINLKQMYGSTEVAGVVCMHRDGEIKFASVGKPVPGAAVRISEAGEILLHGETIFQGYYKNEQATEEALLVDQDGKRWFCTGDAGYIDDDGHVIYLDRMKDMLILANGERYSPQFIEGRLKFNPYILDVFAVGGTERDYVTALITINFDNVGQWAEKQGIGHTTFVDLSQKSQVYELIRQALVEVNQSLPAGAQVRQFVLMHKEFDADEAEMTRTRKLRRGFLYERYHDIIEAMYDGQQSIRIKAPVRYQDGTEGFVETDLRIQRLAS